MKKKNRNYLKIKLGKVRKKNKIPNWVFIKTNRRFKQKKKLEVGEKKL